MVKVDYMRDEDGAAVFRYLPDGHTDHAGVFSVNRSDFSRRVVEHHKGDYGSEYLYKAINHAIKLMKSGERCPSFAITWY